MTDIFTDPQPLIDLSRYISQAGIQVRVCVLDPLPDGLTIRYANVALDQAGHPVWTWDLDADVPGMQPGAAERAARAPIVWQAWPEHDGPLVEPIIALAILCALRRNHA